MINTYFGDRKTVRDRKVFNKKRFPFSVRMKAVKVSRRVKNIFKNPPMSAIDNIPPGFDSEGGFVG